MDEIVDRTFKVTLQYCPMFQPRTGQDSVTWFLNTKCQLHPKTPYLFIRLPREWY